MGKWLRVLPNPIHDTAITRKSYGQVYFHALIWNRTRGWKGTHLNMTCMCTMAALFQKHKMAELGLKKVHLEQYFIRSKQWRRIKVREDTLPRHPVLTCVQWVSFPVWSPSAQEFWMHFPSKNLSWPFFHSLHYLQVNPMLHEILIVLSPFPTNCLSPRQKNTSPIYWNNSSFRAPPHVQSLPQPFSGSFLALPWSF